MNPGSAFNCYWEMPFRKRCRITMTNIDTEADDISTTRSTTRSPKCPRMPPISTPSSAASTRCPTRRSTPSSTACKGQGQYVGTYMAWGVNNTGWWGEGEIKFFMDGDSEFPTICGTGTEDYFCGSYNFDVGKENGEYQEFTTPYAGLPQVIRPDGLYASQTALRPLPLAHHGPDPLRAGPARHDPGPRLAQRRPLPARCRTTSPRSRSGTRRCRPRPSRVAGEGLPRSDLV